MAQGIEIEPIQTFQDDYVDLNCPTTGQLCPSRLNIRNLCTLSFDEDEEAPVEVLEEAHEDSRKQSMLLLAHTGLIKIYGCAGENNNMCPPSVASNARPVVQGAKQRIKSWLKG
jgi:hypothetical protein